MYIAVVPAPYYVQGDFIMGSPDYSGLPDFMLWEKPQSEQDRKIVIGGNLPITDVPQQRPKLFKVFGIWDNILYDYTIGTSPEADVFFPISVKKYAGDFSTTLYIRSIDNYLLSTDMRHAGSMNIVSLPELLHLLTANNPEMVLPPSSPAEYYLTQEMPFTISMFMQELGFECLNYSESAAAYMMYNYGKDLAGIRDIFNLRPSNDFISAQGCGNTFCSLSSIYKYVDVASNEFYNTIATAQQDRVGNMFNLQYLDRRSHWYEDLGVDEVLEQMFRLRNTDYNAMITVNSITCDRKMLVGFNPQDDCSDCWDILRSNIAEYNRKAGDPITHVNVCKTWLDEVIFSIALFSGSIENWFLSLSLFHLYSPSIIRRKDPYVMSMSVTL